MSARRTACRCSGEFTRIVRIVSRRRIVDREPDAPDVALTTESAASGVAVSDPTRTIDRRSSRCAPRGKLPPWPRSRAGGGARGGRGRRRLPSTSPATRPSGPPRSAASRRPARRTGLTVHWIDERLTSVAAERRCADGAEARRARAEERIDAAAAALISTPTCARATARRWADANLSCRYNMPCRTCRTLVLSHSRTRRPARHVGVRDDGGGDPHGPPLPREGAVRRDGPSSRSLRGARHRRVREEVQALRQLEGPAAKLSRDLRVPRGESWKVIVDTLAAATW